MTLPAKHYLETKELVTIAVLACMGAVASTYLGYIGHMLGSATGIPFLSQLLTGLHVFWVVLVLALVDKKGAGLLCAVLDNLVQFLMGSHIGILVLPVGLMQGLLAETGYWTFRRLGLVQAMLLAGGLGSISHIILFQVAFHQFGTPAIALGLAAVAFPSGVCLGGIFPYGAALILHRAGVVRIPGLAPTGAKRKAVA
ncbi:MAG: ECF transporter S component [Syntrophobacteraceae bacterium]|nr:ECF transporter S component [Syntrophobacteraceae bacterium]